MSVAAQPLASLEPPPRAIWLPLVFVPLVAWFKDAAVVAIALAALMALLHPPVRIRLAAGLRVTPATGCAAAFFAWSLLAVAWSPSHDPAGWVKAALAAALAFVAGRGVAALAPAQAERLAGALIAAELALYALLLVERLTGGALIGLVRTGDSRARLFDVMSPGLVILTGLAFPTASLLRRRLANRIVPAAFVAACLALGLTYRMDAAPVALGAAAIAFAIVRLAGRRGFAFVALGIAAAALSWGSLAAAAARHGLDTWLTAEANLNWGYRVEIWSRVHELIGQRFWFGHGFDAARVLGQAQKPAVAFLHPHNGLLQVWLELGAVGVVLLLAWAAAAAVRASRQASAPATTAAAVTALSVFWLISFGIWQGWWVSAIGLVAGALVLVNRPAPRGSQPGSSASSTRYSP